MEVLMETHYDTLWALFDDVSTHYGIKLPMITGGIKYGEYRKFHFDVGHKKKQLHVQVYRLDSGRYEYNGYVL
jgi:hypothetical protein